MNNLKHNVRSLSFSAIKSSRIVFFAVIENDISARAHLIYVLNSSVETHLISSGAFALFQMSRRKLHKRFELSRARAKSTRART